jgi:3-hydroxyacyl-CoA dehydrogenase/enoyl-CoA hydratase/3-hydroxybutyryl-CoA epimerase
VENADLKRKLYGRLEPQMKASSILASNTSTIPITRLADGLLIVISIPITPET